MDRWIDRKRKIKSRQADQKNIQTQTETEVQRVALNPILVRAV